MALTPRKHGVSINQVLKGTTALTLVASSIWGVVVTAPSAEAGSFPLSTPVLVIDLEKAITDLGAEGTGPKVLRAIADHGKSIGVVVVVAEGLGEDDEEIAAHLDANVIAGLSALLLAEQTVAVRPRILGAPGLDTRPVTTALEVVLPKLNAFGYAAAIGATPAEIYTYRGGFSARELMLIDRDFTASDAFEEEDGVAWATARAIGLRSKLDRTIGYHQSLSNQAVSGVTGIVEPRTWDMQSADTEMGLINGADVTGLVQRNGYRFWGNRTCSDEPTWAFETAVRSDQILNDTIVEGLFPFIDRPLNRQLAIDIIESINALFRREIQDGRIIDAKAYLAEGNTPDQLRLGKLKIGKRWMFTPPLEDLTVDSWIDDSFWIDFADFAA